MFLNIRQSADLLSGVLFTAIGLGGIALSLRLDFGTPARMGAGFFPMSLSVILLALGVIVLGVALLRSRQPVGRLAIRPVFAILLGVVLFSLAVERFGFVISGSILIATASAAEGRFRVLEVTALAAVLVAVTSVIFVIGLRLPLPLWPT